MFSYSDIQASHSASASATISTWSRMPTDDSKMPRLIYWWLTLDAEFQRHVHNITVFKGELTPLLTPVPTPDNPLDPDYIAAVAAFHAIILERPIEPIQPLNFAAPLDVSIFQLAINRYDRQLRLYLVQQQAFDHLKTQMLSSLDEATKSVCFPDKTQLNAITFYGIYNAIADHFSTPTPAHIASIDVILAEPFSFQNANSYDAHQAKHLEAQAALAAMLSEKRPLEKCNDFRRSLLNSEHAADFIPYLTIYDAEHVSLHNQNLHDLTQACLPAMTHIMAKSTAQSSMSQFAVNAVNNTTPPPTIPRTPGIKRWCWTHGTMFHSSDHCKKPTPGHQKSATVNNKMGSTK